MLLAGPSGSGKSTLLRALAGLLLTADVGDLAGEVLVDGTAPQARPGQVGLLLQDPTAAVVADRVGRDVAFGLENTGVARDLMPGLVDEALRAARFPYGPERRTGTLSGGESQRLALAGALAMQPRILLLDEPTSMLDADNAAAVRHSVLEVVAERGTTLVVAEHHLEPWVDHVDRVVVLDQAGRVVADGAPAEVLHDRSATLAGSGVWVPGLADPAPLDLDPALVRPGLDPPRGVAWVEARDVTVRHRSPFARALGRGEPTTALLGVDADLTAGEALLLSGPSGAGKSTLLAVLAGLHRPDTGTALLHPSVGLAQREASRLTSRQLAPLLAWVPQHPEHGVVRPTVLDEVLLTSRALGVPPDAAEERARALLDALGLGHLLGASSYHLSGGEQRRLVLAAALTHGPAGLLLDEPTVGQDRQTWASVTGACRSAATAGAAVAVATHDSRAATAIAGPTAAGPADRSAVPRGGRLDLDRGVVRSAA